MDNNKGSNVLLCQVLLTMRRHKGIIKTVGLESPLFVYFLGEQKMDTRAVAELKIYVKSPATKSQMLTQRAIRESPLQCTTKKNLHKCTFVNDVRLKKIKKKE